MPTRESMSTAAVTTAFLVAVAFVSTGIGLAAGFIFRLSGSTLGG